MASTSRSIPHSIPRVPFSLPWLGISLHLMRDDPARIFVNLYERYGPVFAEDKKVIYVIGPEANAAILKSGAGFSVDHSTDYLQPILGNSAIQFMDGAEHKKIRTLMIEPIRGGGLTQVAPIMRDVVQAEVAQWDSIPVFHAMQRLTLKVILRAGFGAQAEADTVKLGKYLDRIFRGAILSPFFFAEAMKSKREVNNWLISQIASIRNNPSPNSIFGLLIKANDQQGNELTDDDIFDNVRLLMVAGQEMTAAVLAWAIIHLALDDAIWDAVCQEVAPASTLPLSFQETKVYRTIEALLNESLRRYTPIWGIRRAVATDDCMFYGYHIPRGFVVEASPFTTQHLSQFWPDPFRFDIGRWFSDTPPTPDTFLPFGSGAHVCLGAAFSMVEMTQTIVQLAAQRMRPVLEARYNLRPVALPLIHPRENIRVRFRKT